MSDDFDAVVVGSGPGGGASAWALANQGIKTLVLESGPSFNPFRDYKLDRMDWERHDFPQGDVHSGKYTFGPMQKLHPDLRHLESWNHISGPANASANRTGLRYLHVRGVGGSSLHYTGEAHRLNPDGMKMASRFSVAADWPISYDELQPFYQRAEQVLGVSGTESDHRRPRNSPFPLPAHPPSYASKKVISATRRSGLRWHANTLAVPSRAYDGRPPCNYCGNCNRGCPRTDKGSVDVTFIRKALATGNCIVRSEHTVTEIIAGDSDKVSSVRGIDEHGDEFEVATRVLIVACGAIETPRLLQLSRNSRAPHGIANENGQVGQHFMETLSWFSSGLHPEPLGSYRGLPNDIICWDYNHADGIPNSVGGCRFYPGTAEQSLIGPINYANRVVDGWGKEHKQKMREQFGRAITIAGIGECLPNSRSFIELDDNVTDRFGQPVARIHTYLDKDRIACLSFMAAKCREILDAMGVVKIFEEKGTYDRFVSTHVFGTCRMGNRPETSVVDPTLRAHEWKNLYVVDSSVFPSSGGGEGPSLTIEALALRTGEVIRKTMIERTA